MSMGVSLRMLTLNCWGVPLVTSDKTVRFKFIAEELSKGEYDVIALQEVIYTSDYTLLCDHLSLTHPFHHYFHSGIKSGVCIFSNCPIIESAIFYYSLNSSPYKLNQLDWYARRMLGLVKIKHKGFIINIFTTHVCAIYTPLHYEKSDVLFSHRLAQCYEISNIIRQVGTSANVNVLMGDFNSEPFSLAKKVLMANAGLKDVWDERPNADDGSGETCECDTNCYTGLVHRVYEQFPKGMRIDYIMYNTNSGYKVQCTDARLALRKIPHSGLNPSDHEAVSATLEIQHCHDAQSPSPSNDLPSLLDNVEEKFLLAYNEVQHKRFQSAYLAALLGLLLFVIQLTSIMDIIYAKFVMSAFLVLVIWICLWDVCVQRVFEANSFMGLLENVRIRKMYSGKF
ncbi:sphingomyelin phosphodiesterase 2-like [Antedon mediterranea]|uniref:sphingomyelin phosphodiesterase 2-like n=1 Tax=Antedon mediterranea TaxID=105859 RepID=UPI003AF63923